MGKKCVLAVDQGTSSSRAILFDDESKIICKYAIEHEPIKEHPDWLEHDPHRILEIVIECIEKCFEIATTEFGIVANDVKAIGITNQRESLTVWNKHTGRKLYNMILWSDLRTHDTCEMLRRQYSSKRVQKISGLPISTYFSGVKLRWMLDNDPDVEEAVQNGTAICGTVDTWLAWNLTKERVHVTDVTNAGRTMMMDIHTLEWNEELMNMVGAHRSMLPEIRSSSEFFGTLNCTALEGTPIASLIGDQQSALVGQGCFNIGDAKNTYGTGCFLITNTGTTPKYSKHGLLTTPAYQIGPNEPCVYSLEGSVSVAGSAINWLYHGLGIIGSAPEVNGLAGEVNDTGGIVFVPALSGLLAPHWNENARGMIIGITPSTTKAHIARATMEGICFSVTDVMNAMNKDMGQPIKELKVDGGASQSDLLMQTQANLVGVRTVRPQVVETTALGAAFLAGLVFDVFYSQAQFQRLWQKDRDFKVETIEEERTASMQKWRRALTRALDWDISDRKEYILSDWIPSTDTVLKCTVAAATACVATIGALKLRSTMSE